MPFYAILTARLRILVHFRKPSLSDNLYRICTELDALSRLGSPDSTVDTTIYIYVNMQLQASQSLIEARYHHQQATTRGDFLAPL